MEFESLDSFATYRQNMAGRIWQKNDRQTIFGERSDLAMTEPMLKIKNHHVASCGDPPMVASDAEHVYLGYFENRHGEQWIFTFDRKTRAATLRGVLARFAFDKR